jgi:hypothetical protein
MKSSIKKKKESLEEKFSSQGKMSIRKFRAKFAEDLRALSKYTESYKNGKNGGVQPISSK